MNALPDVIPSLRDYMVFEQHVRTARQRRGLDVPREWYEGPTFYYSNPFNRFGDGDEVPKPAYTQRLDFELELACVIGTAGRDIAAEDAEAHIAGFTILNDWSARDVQRQEMAVGLGPAKGKEFAYSLGPRLATRDELAAHLVRPGVYDLKTAVRINGSEISRGSTREMQWGFCELIEHASRGCELQIGDVIGSGTVGGGCLLELGTDVHAWLEPGDEVELHIEAIGTLRNRVIA